MYEVTATRVKKQGPQTGFVKFHFTNPYKLTKSGKERVSVSPAFNLTDEEVEAVREDLYQVLNSNAEPQQDITKRILKPYKPEETSNVSTDEYKEMEALYESILKMNDETIKHLKEKVDMLSTECENLKSRLDYISESQRKEINAYPLLFDVSEIYPHEVNDIILDAIESCKKSLQKGRRQDILENILKSTKYYFSADKMKDTLKKTLISEGYCGKRTVSLLESYGFTVSDTKEHIHVTHKNCPDYMIVFGKTPSDYRSDLNTLSVLVKFFL